MDRALREFRIRGVKTNIPFLENVIANATFRAGQATTTLHRHQPGAVPVQAPPRPRHQAADLSADITVNGNPHAKGWKPAKTAAGRSAVPNSRSPARTPSRRKPRQLLLELGPEKFAEWIADEKRLLITDTTFRDAHQSLLATRMRTFDMLRVADAVARRTARALLAGNVGRRDLRHRDALPQRSARGSACASLREKVPNICFQMLFRGSNAVGYSNYPDNVVAGFIKHAADTGMDIFRIFDSLNYLPNLHRGHGGRAASTHVDLRSAPSATPATSSTPKRDKYSLEYYVASSPRNWSAWARTCSASRTWPASAAPLPRSKLVKALKEEIGIPDPLPHPRHQRHQRRQRSCAPPKPAWTSSTLAIASHVRLHLPAEPQLHRRRPQHTPRDTGLDLDALNEFSDYWEQVRALLQALRHRARATARAEVYLHEMPGGQYTNLKEQANAHGHRPPLARNRPHLCRGEPALRRHRQGHAVVSKVVGDMCMFLVTRGIKAGGRAEPQARLDRRSRKASSTC